jgi:hypothetical protein
VTLKAIRADVSSKPQNENPELVVPRSLQVAFPDFGDNFQTIEDHFIVRGGMATTNFSSPRLLVQEFWP